MDNDKIQLTLKETRPEAGNAKTFIFNANDLTWIAGQYQKYTLPNVGADEEENSRYFTISSAPSEGTINITTRISDSSFKQALNALTPGDAIYTNGPEGDFVWDQETKHPIVLVAAGIGVTPYRSMLLERKANGLSLDATLLYFNRNDEIPYLADFKKLSEEFEAFNFIPVVGQRVTAERILERVPQALDGTFYLSGPEPMVEAIGEELKAKEITLKQDWFPGYTDETF